MLDNDAFFVVFLVLIGCVKTVWVYSHPFFEDFQFSGLHRKNCLNQGAMLELIDNFASSEPLQSFNGC